MTAVARTGPRAAATASLDVFLTDPAVNGTRRFIAPRAIAGVAGGVARRPHRVIGRAAGLGTDLARVAVGRSERAPAKGDRRFGDPAWQHNWLLRRVLQGYLSAAEAVDGVISDAELDWQTERQARFAAGNVLDAARADELPLVEPRGAQGDRRRGGRQPRPRREALRRRLLIAAAAAAERRHLAVRGGRQPRASRPARSCSTPTCSS